MDAIQSTSAAPSAKYIAAIEAALRLLVDEDSVTEIRGLQCVANGYRRPHNRGGFFHSSKLHDAARSAFAMSAPSPGFNATGVYFTLNPLKPEILARRCNRIDITKEGEAASDSDILKRRWLLVDCDPIRTRGVSSSDAEKKAAFDKAIAIRDHFAGRGWPDPILCDSGNGWHLLYRIDLPNTDESTKLVKRCLRAISAAFTDAAVSIDTSVFNAARICKLYGTMTRKGDSTEDRPHRLARLVKGPTENHRPIDELYLTALASEAPEETRGSGSGTAGGKAPPSSGDRRGKSIGDRAAEYLSRMPESISGQHGHDKAYRAACILVRGYALEPEAAFPILWDWNSRCQPPWSERELMHKLEDAAANADGEAGYLIYADRKAPGSDDLDVSQNEFLPVAPVALAETNPLDGLSIDLDGGELTATAPSGEALPTTANDVPFAVPPINRPPIKSTVQELLTDWQRDPAATPDAPSVPECDDDPHRLARVFLRRHQAECPTTGKTAVTLRFWKESFFAWDGRCYAEVSKSMIHANITRAIKKEFDSITAIRMKAASRDPSQAAPVAKKVGGDLINNVLNAVKEMTILAEYVEQPIWLDGRYPSAKGTDFIAVSNGILDVAALMDDERSADALLPHSPFWFSTSCVPYPYDPEATCPTWNRFLLTNLKEDDEQIRILQEWFGYCLTQDTSQQKFLMMEGRGKNGKSVILAALTAILGPQNVSTVPLEAFEKEVSLAQTIGKLANIAAEIGEVDRVAEGVLKSFTSGDRMTFKRLYKDPFTAYPTARLVFATNNRPRFSDRSDGLWRRMILLHLTYQVPDDERVFGMDRPSWWHDLGELPGMLNWALAGLWELRRYGRFTTCTSGEAEIDEYRNETNPTRQFLTEYFQWGGDGQWIVTAEAYERYKNWCDENGCKPVNNGNFGKEIVAIWPKAKRVRRRGTAGPFWSYEGVMKIPELENEFTNGFE